MPGLHDGLLNLLGPRGFLSDPASCLVYSRDASHMTLGRPLGVALPENASQVAKIIQLCAQAKVPVVCRGTGTGLSGGAVPPEGAVVLSTSRLDRLGKITPGNPRISCEPGVLNVQVSRAAVSSSWHFAPDPSSQAAASIGGNIAENAGGPHCLRHGVTLQHVLGLDWIDARGRATTTGDQVPAQRGFHLASLLCGSEGTLGIVVDADLNLVPDGEQVVTLLAIFPDLGEATSSVVTLLSAGLLPVAVEMVDQPMLQAVEEAFAFGFPTDVEAAMICEFSGSAQEVEEDSRRAGELLQQNGAREIRKARDETERLELWKCRKKAFGAVGRLAPRYITMDIVVPLAELPGHVRQIQAIKQRHRIEIATAFHAGDGNLHPGVHYDDRDPDARQRAQKAADAIIRDALNRGGSCTGEHGVGLEKLHTVPWQIDACCARIQRDIKALFDPENILNPGKMLPDPGADFAPIPRRTSGVDFTWDSMTVSAGAEVALAEVQHAALERGLWIPVGFFGPDQGWGLGRAHTVGHLFNHLLTGPALLAGGHARDCLLELWAVTGDGQEFHTGAPVFKNVAGYSLAQALCGAGGGFVSPLAATFQLRPAPEQALALKFKIPGQFNPGPNSSWNDELAILLDRISRRSMGTAGSTVILDTEQGMITLMTAGRHRPWDLGGLPDLLLSCWEGLELVHHRQVDFSRAHELLDLSLVPDGMATAPDSASWTSWQARRGQNGLIPPGPGHWVWQSHPRIWWSPSEVGEGTRNGWSVEPFCRRGKIVPALQPQCPVAGEYLQGLQGIFAGNGASVNSGQSDPPPGSQTGGGR